MLYLETNEKAEKYQQRHRGHKKEPNGNNRTEKYNTRNFLNSRVSNSVMEKPEDGIEEQKARSIKRTQTEQQRATKKMNQGSETWGQ